MTEDVVIDFCILVYATICFEVNSDKTLNPQPVMSFIALAFPAAWMQQIHQIESINGAKSKFGGKP